MFEKRMRIIGDLPREGGGRSVPMKIGLIVSLFVVGSSLSGCDLFLLAPAGPVGVAEKAMLIDAVVIMLAIIGPIIVATLAFAWWYRADNKRALYRPDFSHSGRIELVVWSIPLLTITFLGGIAWIGAHELDPAQPLASKVKPLEVEVVSLDWKWLFIYPAQHVASVNALTVPAGTPVHFTLTSASVWGSFFVPELGSMIYTMSGMATQLYLQADHPGSYYGLSTNLSGDGFSDMHFVVNAVPDAAFGAWVKGAQASGPVLDDAAYTQLAKQSVVPTPVTYRSVAPDLFGKVVSLRLAPGPGPEASSTKAGAAVFPKSDAKSDVKSDGKPAVRSDAGVPPGSAAMSEADAMSGSAATKRGS